MYGMTWFFGRSLGLQPDQARGPGCRRSRLGAKVPAWRG